MAALINMDDLAAAQGRQLARRAPLTSVPARTAGRMQALLDMAGVSPEQARQELAARGIDSFGELIDALDSNVVVRTDSRFQAPPPPRRSISALYSDVEVIQTTLVDSNKITIPTVAISSTADTTITQLPVRWGFTDFTVGGEVAASGKNFKVEIQIILGTQRIASFGFDQMLRAEKSTFVLDALQKVYKYDIGPLSTVKVRVINDNSGAGQVFDGYFQYTYQVLDENGNAIQSSLQGLIR